jgi:hypothetical protein
MSDQQTTKLIMCDKCNSFVPCRQDYTFCDQCQNLITNGIHKEEIIKNWEQTCQFLTVQCEVFKKQLETSHLQVQLITTHNLSMRKEKTVLEEQINCLKESQQQDRKEIVQLQQQLKQQKEREKKHQDVTEQYEQKVQEISKQYEQNVHDMVEQHRKEVQDVKQDLNKTWSSSVVDVKVCLQKKHVETVKKIKEEDEKNTRKKELTIQKLEIETQVQCRKIEALTISNMRFQQQETKLKNQVDEIEKLRSLNKFSLTTLQEQRAKLKQQQDLSKQVADALVLENDELKQALKMSREEVAEALVAENEQLKEDLQKEKESINIKLCDFFWRVGLEKMISLYFLRKCQAMQLNLSDYIKRQKQLKEIGEQRYENIKEQFCQKMKGPDLSEEKKLLQNLMDQTLQDVILKNIVIKAVDDIWSEQSLQLEKK